MKKKLISLLGLAGFIVMADNWVVSPILPAISQNLNIDIARAGLLISAYMIPFGVFQVIFGPLADRYGKKQVITFSMIAFTIATGLCAFGSALTSLAVFRALTCFLEHFNSYQAVLQFTPNTPNSFYKPLSKCLFSHATHGLIVR